MNETSLSLLHRLREAPESESWNRLLHLYAPLLRVWLRKYEVQESDADDLVQEVLLAVAKDLGKFEHRGHVGSFRGWIKTIMVNRLRKFWRGQERRPKAPGGSDIAQRLALLEDQTSHLSQLWNREHDHYVLRQLLEMVQPHFATKTWEAFHRVAVQGAKPNDVARELDISLNSVCLAKSRVMRRLRQEAAGLIESSSGFFADR